MRQLSKGPKPNILVQNGAVWRDEYLQAVAVGTSSPPARWKHEEIQTALRQEADEKCVYCEGSPRDISYPHVDHIVPKKVRPELVVEWTNLAHACGVCNVEKRDHFDANCPIVNPFADDPSDHLMFLGALVRHRDGKARGEITWRQLDLNRPDLVLSRARRIDDILNLVDRWFAAAGQHKHVLEKTIRREADRGEFSSSVKSALLQYGFPM